MRSAPLCGAAAAPAQAFSEPERAAVYRAIHERRDMRHFSGGELAPELLRRLLEAAHHAPSVGFMQPWRFMRIRRPELRQQLHALVEAERLRTAAALGVRQQDFMRLKVQGVPEGAEVVALLCLGPVQAFYAQPMLEQERWARRAALPELVFEDRWGQPSDLFAAPEAADA